MYQSITPSQCSRGVTLIEVLITILVLGLGLLGVAALQANALKINQSALQRSQASMLAYFMLDAMRANLTDATAGNYDLGTLPSTSVCTAPTGTTLITHDQAAWFTALKENLGNVSTTCGLIACNTTSCTVKVFWDDSRAGGENTQKVEVTSRL